MKRALGLYIPFLSTDRLRNEHKPAGQPNPVVHPVATVASYAGVLRVVHANHAAYEQRIRPGHTLAEANAMVPTLDTHDDDPIADRHTLETLTAWADAFSPIVHIEGEDTLLLDVTGCHRLFGSEETLLHRAIDGLEGLGYTSRGAVADTPGGAWAIAHARRAPAFVSAPGEVIADLALLPVWSLRIDDRTTDALASVGVDSVASLLHLPRSSLASRFGDTLLEHLDRALGDLPEVLTPYRTQPEVTSRVSFGAPTTRFDTFHEGLRVVLERFCDKLAQKVGGVRQLFVTFYCPEVPTEEGSQRRTVTLPMNLSQITRSAKYLHSLAIVLIEKLNLPAPADALMVWAREVDVLDGWQDELFATDADDAHQLSRLVDRLTVRLGRERVVRPQRLSEHQPERAFQYTPCVDCKTRNAKSRDDRTSQSRPPDPRPLRLLRQPLEVAATAVVPEGPPIAFQYQGMRHTIANSVGPERIETGWWRGPHLKRDYYRVATSDGRRFWLFRHRDTSRWFVHGWFD